MDRTSISDINYYKNAIKLALNDDNIFNKFKTLPEYNVILEHASYNLGLECLKNIKKNNSVLLNHINEFKENDRYGGTIKFFYDEIGEISPNTLRYINVLSDFLSLNIDLNNKDIIEIGVGYGGQCLILSKYFNFKSYTLVDLIEPLELSKKYLELNNINNVFYKNMEDLEDGIYYDMVISNYAYSECNKEVQDIYYDKILKNSKNGYMILNFISKIHNIDSYSKDEIREKIPNSYFINEIPESSNNNIILIWNKNKK